MADYQKIYNQVVSSSERYNLAENSPGFRNVIQATDKLSAISGRCLDVGCGVGFALEYLAGRAFSLHPHGVDASDLAVEQAETRLKACLPKVEGRVKRAECMSLPFEDDYFSLVTSFDVLEHLDESDVFLALAEISRVVRNGGMFFGSVSCRASKATDLNGENLHRTVRTPDWWIKNTNPDQAIYDGHREQLTLWKRAPFGKDALLFDVAKASVGSASSVAHHPADSKELYQKIYDDNPWYGDATEGRCPGVRLLPKYQDWLIGPVIDLGCGRGHTVERLRELGFEAEGIDQIRKHPDMMVGDITKPIDNLGRFQSAVCVDCIEHLYDEQVQGLFANMKQVQRQAFSIHNGESTGTGQELHVNRRPFDQWRTIIGRHFEIEKEIALHDNQMLYLTRQL
ncbi:class I SAM-dependent methyltransferase [Mariniblastus fucicola]|uniref:Demethylrebeccamycin-D-glucose O-methyltransferase n=1 Tax=Mariniblastus fucicola TaxID=980251 RepID=A0A5B9P4Z8_9BACT|nr:class I SAM-dependent methyltransferase [Mariniblastus fucicola]QEG21354.1 Demethylrebeccamycin-D-glucose O-methyltransferase [Mariniblastus fucicola]